MPDNNPYLQTVDSMFGEDTESDLRQSLIESMSTNPDTAAKALPYAQKKQIPLDMAERNLPELEADHKFESIDFAGLKQQNPMLSDFLRDRENAMLAHDDIGALTRTADFFRSFGQGLVGDFAGKVFTGAGRSGREIAEFGAEGLVKEQSLRTPEQRNSWVSQISDFMQQTSLGVLAAASVLPEDFLGRGLEATGEMIAPPESRRNLATDIGAGLGQVTGQVGATLLTGGAGSLLMSLFQGTALGFESADRNKKEGGEAITAAALYAGITVLTEKYGLDAVMKGIPPSIKRQVISKIAVMVEKAGLRADGLVANALIKTTDTGYRAATEALQEATEGLLQNLVDKAVLDDDKELIKGLGGQAAVGASVGGIVGGLVNLMVRGKTSLDVAREKATIEEIKAAREAAQSPKLFQRAVGKMNQRIREDTGDQNFHLSSSPVQTFYQSLSPEDMSRINEVMPDLKAQIEEAALSGGDIVINRADYFTYVAPMPGSEALDEYIRFEPEDMSAGDRAEYEEMMRDLYDLAQFNEIGQTDGEQVESNFARQLVQKVGQRSAPSGNVEVSALLSQNPRKFYETILERSGDDPRVKSILDRLVRDVIINRPIPNLDAFLKKEDFDLTIDQARTRARNQRRIQEKAASAPKNLLGETKKKKGKAAQTPVISWLSKKGGVAQGSPLAGELAVLDVTPKSHPQLFRKNGSGAFDNIVAQEFNSDFQDRNLVAQEDGNGYVDQDWLLDQIRAETFGEGAKTNDELLAEQQAAYLDDLLDVMDRAGIDVENATNPGIKKALRDALELQTQQPDAETFFQSAPPVESEAFKNLFGETKKNKGKAAMTDPRIVTESSLSDDKLVTMHNISEKGLIHADKIGGLPVPSLAITRPDIPFTNFGDISLIAPVSMIDPKQNKESKVFDADVYSPRYPKAIYETDVKKFNEFVGLLENLNGGRKLRSIQRLSEDVEAKGIDGALENSSVRLAYLEDKGIAPESIFSEKKKTVVDINPDLKKFVGTDSFDLKKDPEFLSEIQKVVDGLIGENPDFKRVYYTPEGELNNNILRSYAYDVSKYSDKVDLDDFAFEKAVRGISVDDADFYNWVTEKFAGVVKTEKIFDGFTNSGNRRYLPHNLDTVVKIMKRSLKDGEGFNYGIPSIRASLAKKFTSLKAVKDDSGRLISSEDMDKVKDEIGKDFDSLWETFSGKLKYESTFGDLDQFTETLKEYGKTKKKSSFNYMFKDLSENEIAAADAFLDKLVNLPTQYFEVKMQRPVKLDEFAGAVVSDRVSQKALEVLDNNGVKYVTFKHGDDLDRVRAVQSFAQNAKKVFFQSSMNETTRGSIAYMPDGQAIISLFERENLSTVLHELGHLYWKAMTDIAALDNAPEQIKKDVDTIRVWVGAKDGAMLTVDQEEKIADGFLDYIRRGEAPSVDLQGAFQRMGAWIKRLYRGIRDTLPSITPEVKDVFDRMRATDAEIERVRAVPSFSFDEAISGLLPKAQAERMRKKFDKSIERAKERLLVEALKEAEQQQTKTYKEERARVEASVTRAVDSEQSYQVINLIKQHGGLSRKVLRKEYGAEIFKYFSGHGGGLLAKTGGANPADVAALSGYTSSREMVDAIMNTAPRAARIKELTDAEMKSRYGDLFNDGTIERAALEAYHNNLRAEVLAMEAEVLADLAGMPAPTKGGIKALAIKMMGAKKVGEIQPYRHLRAENKAYFEYGKALGKKEFAKAARAKAQQLLNHHLFMMSSDAKSKMEKKLKGWRKLERADQRIAQTMGLDIDYVYAARSLLANHGIGKSDYNFNAWREALERENPDLAQSLSFAIAMHSEAAQLYKDMAWSDFQALGDAVDNLIEVGRDQRNMTVGGKKMGREAVRSELLDRASVMPDSGVASGRAGKLGKSDKRKLDRYGIKAWWRRVESWVEVMDGGASGPWRTYIWNPVVDALDSYRTDKAEKLRGIYNLLSPHQDRLLGEKIAAPELISRQTGESYIFENKGELIGMLMHLGNGFDPGSNGHKLLHGYGWVDVMEDGTEDMGRFQSFLNRMHNEEILKKEDWDLVQSLWDMAGSLKPEVWRAHKEMYGFRPDEVTEVPISTPFGVYKGGYWPAIVDKNKSDDAQLREDRSIANRQDNMTAFPTTGRGATKSRDSRYVGPLEMNLNLLPKHLDWALRFIHLEPTVKDIAKLLTNKEFREGVARFDPAAVSEMLMPWLQRVARQSPDLPKAGRFMSWANRQAAALRRKAGANIMFGNLLNAVQQFTGFIPIVRAVGARNFAHGLVRYMGAPKSQTAMIHEASAYMAFRQQSTDRDLLIQIQNMLEERSLTEKIGDKSAKIGYIYQSLADGMVTKIGWLAAHEKALYGGVPGIEAGDEAGAQRYADSIIRMTQGSLNPEDLSNIESMSELGRLFTMFQGFFITQGNYLVTESKNIARSDRSGIGKANAYLSLYVMIYLLPSILSSLLMDGLQGNLPDDDDDDGMVLDDWLKYMSLSQVKYGGAMVPIVSPVLSVFIGGFTEARYDDRINISPAASLVEQVVDTPRAVADAIFSDGDWSVATRDVLASIGAFTNIPVGFIKRPVTYLVDVAEEDANPDGMGDLFQGLLTGREVKK